MKIANSFLPILLTIFVTRTAQTQNDTKIQVFYQWSFADYQFPNEQLRLLALNQELFVPPNVAILDSDYYVSPRTSRTRFFVTTPLFRSGIPATVSEVSKEKNDKGENLLKPFPNWDSQGIHSCEYAVSAYRIYIDKCGLMWVLDTGLENSFVHPNRVCRPKLLIYDLNSGDTLIERYEFPDGTVYNQSTLITLITESYRKDCLDSVAYIADVDGYGLIVFDLAKRNSWRISHNFFYPFPTHGTMTIAGVTFDLMDGLFGLALGPGYPRNRKLYFHSFASVREAWVPTSVLKNTAVIHEPDLYRDQFTLSDEARPGHSTLEVMTDDGILLFALLPQNAIACWNSANPYTEQNLHIVYQDDEKLQFISGMKLKGGKTLLITSSKLQNYIVENFDYPDVKYRLITIDDVNELLRGTPCMPRKAWKFSLTPKPQSYQVHSS